MVLNDSIFVYNISFHASDVDLILYVSLCAGIMAEIEEEEKNSQISTNMAIDAHYVDDIFRQQPTGQYSRTLGKEKKMF